MSRKHKNIQLKKMFKEGKKVGSNLECLNSNAAGIDIGSKSIFVAVPCDRDETPVREFGVFTQDLIEIGTWLQNCGIETVAMESTGVYWIPLYQILISKGFEVFLVDARQVKNVPGRDKTDVLDCQWIQKLHTFGLLRPAFVPDLQTQELRHYMRQRESNIRSASRHMLRMHKALELMNLKLNNVLSDITGKTGLRIIEAIVNGVRDPKVLAKLKDPRCKNSEEIIMKSLEGDYRPELIFVLRQELHQFKETQKLLDECDKAIENLLSHYKDQSDDSELPPDKKKAQSRRAKNNAPTFDVRGNAFKAFGVDLTQIPGVNSCAVLVILSEAGFNISKWLTAKNFASWLGNL